MKTLPEFRKLASEFHGNQMYGQMPYSFHLAMVEQVARQYSYQLPERFSTFNMYVACWFHDVLEDTPVTKDQLIDVGLSIQSIDLVEAVTNGEGKNRRARMIPVYERCKGKLPFTFLKLCDRIANIRYSVCAKDINLNDVQNIREIGSMSRVDMYRKEHREFEEYLNTGTMAAMWHELDVLLNQWEK